MSERQTKLSDVWVEDVVQFGEHAVKRPTTHALNALIRRRNKWIADDCREQTEAEALVEWLFVLSRTKQELTKLRTLTLDEWEQLIDEFLGDLEEEVIHAWQAYFERIMDQLRQGAVEDAEPGKPQAEEALNRAS